MATRRARTLPSSSMAASSPLTAPLNPERSTGLTSNPAAKCALVTLDRFPGSCLYPVVPASKWCAVRPNNALCVLLTVGILLGHPPPSTWVSTCCETSLRRASAAAAPFPLAF